MNNQPQQNKVAEATPPQKQRPLVQRLIRGDLSSRMPVVLAVGWLGISMIAQVSWAYTITVLVGLIPLWCIYRFGYQLKITRLLREKKYQQALEVCFRELQSYPDDTFILVNIADAYESLGQHEKAEEYVEQTIEHREMLSLAYLIQAKVIVHYYLEQQKSLIETSPKNADGTPRSHVTPQQLAEEKTRYEAVLKEMDSLFRKQKLVPPVLNVTLAFYFARLGMLERAESELDKVDGNQDPTIQGYILSNRARIYLLRGEKEKALATSTQAKDLLPSYSAVLDTHGLMLLRNERLDEAIPCLDLAIKNAVGTTPEYWEAHYFRAEALEKKGDASKAKQDRETALSNGYIPYL